MNCRGAASGFAKVVTAFAVHVGFGFDCLGRFDTCQRASYATITSGVLFGGFGIWLIIITYLLLTALYDLSKLPYAQYRISNLIIRLQVGVRASYAALVLMSALQQSH